MLSVGKYDSALGIVFFITCIAILNSLRTNNYEFSNFYALLMLSLFSLQIKQTGAYLIFILLPYLIIFINKNQMKFLNFKTIKIAVIFICYWIVKNIITTSCLFYPIEFTCLPFLSWHESNQLDFVSKNMIYSPISFNSNIPISEQALTWFNFSKNSQFIINFPCFTVSYIYIFLYVYI